MPATLPASYDPWIVTSSLLIASCAAYVALDLAKRVREPDPRIARRWWIGGSVALGTSIWCMHFVGMLAFSLPIALRYGPMLTLASWAAAVGASAIALRTARRETLTRRHHAGSALAMGAGISAMHYIGMSAIDIVPGIEWDFRIVAASVAIAVVASAAALEIFFRLRRVSASRGLRYQLVAACAMGAAICGMHYTGMAAASFPVGSVCLGADGLSEHSLGAMAVISAAALLVFTLFTSHIDARVQARTSGLNAELLSANEQLRRRALRDPLTNLPNRLLFERRLAHSIERFADAPAGRIAVLFIDLDGFKPVNDLLGHAVGDLVLKEVAGRLRASVRAGDTVARIGGDEFLLLMDCETALVDPAITARGIVEALGSTIAGADHPIQISCSIGIALYPEHGPKERLVAHADTAMYEAKRAGGNTWAFYEARLEGEPQMLGLQNDLRRALDRSEFELHYQPKVCGYTGVTRGVEALLRWRHPVHGLVDPLAFVPLAERHGMICRIGDWVIEEACRQIGRWAREGLRMNVAVNLSAHQLREEGLVDHIERTLRRNGVHASQLLCEITESVAMSDVAVTQSSFDGLSRLGVMLSIDDFGTGHSSLGYLRRLPARQLKIDSSFVNDLESSSDARAIVSAVVHLAHDLGLDVVAEGVETAGQRDVLTTLSCDEMQGFLFAPPMPAGEIPAWLRSRADEAAKAAKDARTRISYEAEARARAGSAARAWCETQTEDEG